MMYALVRPSFIIVNADLLENIHFAFHLFFGHQRYLQEMDYKLFSSSFSFVATIWPTNTDTACSNNVLVTGSEK